MTISEERKKRVIDLYYNHGKTTREIAKIEDYLKLNQIAKENVKVVLSENKKLISISFAALIQTIKAEPQIVKSIQNIPYANHG